MIFEIKESEIITTDNYLNFCLEEKISYAKTDYFYTWGYYKYINNSKTSDIFWRNEYHPKKLEKICVIGHSDYPVTQDIMKDFDLVFCINKDNQNENCIPLPLGVCNSTEESDKHILLGNVEIISNVIKKQVEKKNLIYLNVDVTTNPSVRQNVIDKFKNFPWVKFELPEYSINGRELFLTNLKESKFVFCPQGNGIDTHRIWETLYMGSYPVVIRHSTHNNLNDLPILFIDSWDEITENFLEQKYFEMKNLNYNYKKLTQSYWNNFILKTIKKIKNEKK